MRYFRWLVLTVLLCSCGLSKAMSPGAVLETRPATVDSLATNTPFQPVPTAAEVISPTATPTLQPTATASTWKLWVDPALPAQFRESLVMPANYALLEASAENASNLADLRIEPGRAVSALSSSGGQPLLLGQWIYALAAPFPTLVDGISADQLHQAWQGENAGPFAGSPLLMDASTLACFSALWGEPAAESVMVLPAEELLSYAWNHQPSWAILPFESLEPRWKVLEVDGILPLRKEFDPGQYALSLPITLTGEANVLEQVKLDMGNGQAAWWQPTNRNPEHLTVLAMTGVTALVRATAYTMEKKGITYPAGAIRDWLRDADLAHISNEVPFAEDCPFPNPNHTNMKFCSDTRYIALLEDVGTDIVELTGDHMQDWGEQATLYTLDLYRQRNWLYYGGGANLEEARQPIKIVDHGNRLAFIGCNAKGGEYAQAAEDHAGAVKCDLEYMSAQIAQLRQEGYLPIVTFQHFEYYMYETHELLVRDFAKMAQAGAVIVSGSQAHQPHGFEFKADAANTGYAFLHYGLGNLFFDQYLLCKACRDIFIDRHVFYEGRYLGTELLTAVFIDLARPRPMTTEERWEFLKIIFSASRW